MAQADSNAWCACTHFIRANFCISCILKKQIICIIITIFLSPNESLSGFELGFFKKPDAVPAWNQQDRPKVRREKGRRNSVYGCIQERLKGPPIASVVPDSEHLHLHHLWLEPTPGRYTPEHFGKDSSLSGRAWNISSLPQIFILYFV